MASERADELYRALIERRYPKELCSEIAYKYLNTDYTATRMLGVSVQDDRAAGSRKLWWMK